MEIIQIVNIVAIVLSPIVAVVVGGALNIHASRRKDKMQVFETLHKNIASYMRSFIGESRDKDAEEAVLKAIEFTTVVFSKEKRVLDARNKMIDIHDNFMHKEKTGENLQSDFDKYANTLEKFIITISKNLGYKNYRPFIYITIAQPSQKHVKDNQIFERRMLLTHRPKDITFNQP